MKCPYCSSTKSKVVDKRDKTDEGVTRRRRECLKCTKRYTTYERIEHVDLSVIKKDGSLEQYDRRKLEKGVRKSVNMDTIGEKGLVELVDRIEMRLLNLDSTQIDSKEIGKIVLDELKDIDPISYMRFASVYRDFASLDQFKAEIEALEKS